MSPANSDLRVIVSRLLAEASDHGGTRPEGAAVKVVERMDRVIGRLAGATGSRSLIARALVLARKDAPWLKAVHIPLEGSLRAAMEQMASAGPDDPRHGGEMLVMHLLELLRTFIGERLTLQLINEAWPHLDLYHENIRKDHAP